jgi:hypothetical protein
MSMPTLRQRRVKISDVYCLVIPDRCDV